jgi:RimJ/RimL family protein N-acetyltransferase
MNLESLQLETPRLLLRPTRREDFEPWAAFMADPESAHHIGGVQPRPVAWRGFLSMAGAWAIQGFAMFSVIEKATGRWIGHISRSSAGRASHPSLVCPQTSMTIS